MYGISVKSSFSSAHFLRNYKGKCENIHGHNWNTEVYVTSNKLTNGMVMDFGDLKGRLGKIISDLDHSFLNEKNCFKKINPTSENIAKYIFKKLAASLPPGVRLERVSVSETEKNTAVYTGR